MIELTVFLAGAIVMSFEILGSRILTPDFGSTVYVWGSIISVFLGGLTIGYWFGGHLADRKANLLIFSQLFIIPGVILCIFPYYASSVCNWIFDLNWDPRYGSLLAATILFLIPILFLGAVSPYAIKLRITNLEWLGTGVGNLYAISSLGSITGTLLTTFYLITWMGVRNIILIEGVILIVTGLLLSLAHFMPRTSCREGSQETSTVES
ncbi:MAG: fused MFS/spermidine synthase [bacterium]|jgi:predicted membrane-bound spermidine synthase